MPRHIECEILKVPCLARRVVIELQITGQEVHLRRQIHRAPILIAQQLPRSGNDQGRERTDERRWGRLPFRLLLLRPHACRQRAQCYRHDRDSSTKSAASRQNVTRKEKNVGFSTCRSDPVRNARARSTPSEPLSRPSATLGSPSPSCTTAKPARTRPSFW